MLSSGGMMACCPPRCRMSRDQRVRDNWALLHAAEVAAQRGVPVAVAFNLVRPAILMAYGGMAAGVAMRGPSMLGQGEGASC